MAEAEKQDQSLNGPVLQGSFQQEESSAEEASRSSDQAQSDIALRKYDKKKLGVLLGSALMQLPLWGFNLSYGMFEEYWRSKWTLDGDLSVTGTVGTTSNGVIWTIRIWAFILAGSGLVSIFLVPTHPSKALRRDGKPPRIPWTFLRHRGIYTYFIAVMLQSSGYCLPQTYLPTFAREFSNANQAISTLLLTLHNIPGILSCFFFGWLTDNKYHQFSATTITCLSAFASSASVLLLWGLSVDGSIASTLVFAILFGFFAGGYSATWGGIIKELEGEAEENNENIDSSLVYGLLNGARGIGFVSGGLWLLAA
ncbi:hypothetical protein IL306_011079 [Fusarium sp. DS 682]|nr:hypothetical protein IL306_011079 [Fusarium sp. DS 682]